MMIDNDYRKNWEKYYQVHWDEFDSIDECLAAFNLIPDVDEQIDQPPREYTNGPRPHGADGEWIEGLTEEDIAEHGEWLGMTNKLYGTIQKFMIFRDTMLNRFRKTFGELE